MKQSKMIKSSLFLPPKLNKQIGKIADYIGMSKQKFIKEVLQTIADQDQEKRKRKR